MIDFQRTIQLLGDEAFQRLQKVHIILFGVGGVGGWCAEALIRTGILNLTIVDFDVINPSNINRQIVATSYNVGLSKVDELRKRLLLINPDARITSINQKFEGTGFDFSAYDYVIDAIDDIPNKAKLICQATSSPATLISSMGAGRKMDTMQIKVAEFWNVQGCPLARALRTHMKKNKMIPSSKFQCVYSPEISGEHGTIAPIVGVFGMTLASLVIKKIATQQ